jgi:hypothetical protein
MLDEVYNYGSFKQSRMFAAATAMSRTAARFALPAMASACNVTPPTRMRWLHIIDTRR